MSLSFTRIEHAIQLVVNRGVTKYIRQLQLSNLRKCSRPRDKDIVPQYFYEYLMHKGSNFCPEVFASIHALKERVAAREKKMAGRWRRGEGCVHARRRLLQTGRTSLRVSLSQTNGLRLFDAVFHRNLLFIIPPARDDIEPCLLVVALMSLIAPPVRTEPSRQPPAAGKP